MMITSAAVGAFLKKSWPLLVGMLLFGMLLTLTYCNGRTAGRQVEVVKQQKREIETQRDLGHANEKAADARLKEAKKATQQEKELTDALNATKDPDRQRALRGCTILRQQGRDTSHIPACR